jgi:O-antigen/teichoic acid export membrane protein
VKQGTATRILFLLLFVGLLFERKASAYVDPGSGALIWQGIASAFVALLFYFRKLVKWTRHRSDREN